MQGKAIDERRVTNDMDDTGNSAAHIAIMPNLFGEQIKLAATVWKL